MRIAVIAPPWLPVPPVAYGGTELVLDGLCRALRAAGHDVLLCTTGDSTCPVERVTTQPASTGVAAMEPSTEIRHAVASHDAARCWGADIIHDHSVTGPLYGGWHPEVAVVTTNHGPFSPELLPLYRVVSTRVPVIAISAAQAASATGVAIAGVVHHGIDTDALHPGPGMGGYALFLGRMSPEKGIPLAIAAARAAGMPLVIAAKMRNREEQSYFEEMVRPRLGPGVDFVGEVDAVEKHRLLGEATCLLNPIQWPEPFGMVMIEALAHGTPVIATPFGAAPEIVDHERTGAICADEEALVDALRAVPAIDRGACRDAAESRFSIRRMAEDHVAVYESVATVAPAPA